MNNSAVLSQDAVGSAGLPRRYNAAVDFIDRHVHEGRADRIAVIDDHGRYSYRDLLRRVDDAAHALRALGVEDESRVALILLDTVNFPACFWGAIKAGYVPVPVNGLLTTENYRHILRDSRARAAVVSAELMGKVGPALAGQPFLRSVIAEGGGCSGFPNLADLAAQTTEPLVPAARTPDDVAFWLYSSGSTGPAKGVRHVQSSLRAAADLFGREILGITEDDVVFSAPKLFFAFGLGNGMTHPFSVGATAVYTAERPTPAAMMRVLQRHNPTIFCGVPTLFGQMLEEPVPADSSSNSSGRLRLCISAGEALPESVGQAWQERFGCEVLDGVGCTEMLHTYLSNRRGEVRYGTAGRPVPGYQLRLVDEQEHDVPDGEVGELLVNGPTQAAGYWNQHEKSLATFIGGWTRTGDKYVRDDAGYYRYCGRADDMMKVGGNWVSPFEVESILIEHPAVSEAAVVPHRDGRGMVKPKAFIVLKSDFKPSLPMERELKDFVKSRTALWKYPRWIEFLEELPKTATGKIKRYELRQGGEREKEPRKAGRPAPAGASPAKGDQVPVFGKEEQFI